MLKNIEPNFLSISYLPSPNSTYMKKLIPILTFIVLTLNSLNAQEQLDNFALKIGVMARGELNAITDVKGVKVGHTTLIEGDSVRTGVTAILPHAGNIFQEKVPAAVFVGNGFGKFAGSTQIAELGNLETPIILTNTLNVATAMDAVIKYTLHLPGNENVRSVNAVVGETNDGYLNDIRGQHVKNKDVISRQRKCAFGKRGSGRNQRWLSKRHSRTTR